MDSQVSDQPREPELSRDERLSVTVSERKIWTNPLVLPARLCGAAAGNHGHCYNGKVCCLLLVRADYIRPRGPEGTGNCSSCYGQLVSTTVRTGGAGLCCASTWLTLHMACDGTAQVDRDHREGRSRFGFYRSRFGATNHVLPARPRPRQFKTVYKPDLTALHPINRDVRLSPMRRPGAGHIQH